MFGYFCVAFGMGFMTVINGWLGHEAMTLEDEEDDEWE